MFAKQCLSIWPGLMLGDNLKYSTGQSTFLFLLHHMGFSAHCYTLLDKMCNNNCIEDEIQPITESSKYEVITQKLHKSLNISESNILSKKETFSAIMTNNTEGGIHNTIIFLKEAFLTRSETSKLC